MQFRGRQKKFFFASQECALPVHPLSSLFPLVNMDFQTTLNLQASIPVHLV
jgi:hypothetical protein